MGRCCARCARTARCRPAPARPGEAAIPAELWPGSTRVLLVPLPRLRSTFLQERVKAHQARPAPPSHLAQYFTQYKPAQDYQRVQVQRSRLAQATAHIKAQLEALDVEEARAASGEGDVVAG